MTTVINSSRHVALSLVEGSILYLVTDQVYHTLSRIDTNYKLVCE